MIAPAMPLARVGRAYLTEAKYESLRMLRSPAFAGPFLLIPVALYSFFVALTAEGSGGADANTPAYLFTGFSVFAIMGPALFGFGMSVALEREQGLLRLKRALPMPPMAYLAAKMLMAMLFSGLASLALTAAALLLSPLALGAARFAGILAINVIGTLPFCAIGLFIGARVTGRTAPAIVNLVYLPMIYLSGLFIPLPSGIRFVALFSPAFHLNQLALNMAGVGAILPVAMHTAALAGVTVLFAGLTVRRIGRNG
ncbi:MAG: ABC transporter permease [Vicinamibacterales bacterium]